MSGSIDERVLALAGLLQALHQVRRIAETGQSDAATISTALDSVFRIDAESPEVVYGSASALDRGLRLLRDYLSNAGKDEALPKLALAIVQLERRFASSPEVLDKVQAGLVALAPSAAEQGSSHPDVIAGLGSLYAGTISHLRPRVLVQGNPHYLGQANVVAEVRAVLLAAMRSAVLWRQLGGSLWDFVLRRKEMLAAIDAKLV